jgi:hypothetical protein
VGLRAPAKGGHACVWPKRPRRAGRRTVMSARSVDYQCLDFVRGAACMILLEKTRTPFGCTPM